MKETENKNDEITVEDFLRKYSKNYSWLYDHYDAHPDRRKALEAFDEYVNTESGLNFIRKVSRARGDGFCSDRECAAFMLTVWGTEMPVCPVIG